MPSPTKFVLGCLSNVQFVSSSNIGDFCLCSYSMHPDALVIYPNGDSDNRNWFFVEYVTQEGNNPEANDGIRIWKTQMNLDADYNIRGADQFYNAMPDSPYNYLEAVHPEGVWNYYMPLGQTVTPYTQPSTSYGDTFYTVGGNRFPENPISSGITLSFDAVNDGNAVAYVDIEGSVLPKFEAAAALTGPANVQAGDTFVLTFGMEGKNVFTVSGRLHYDSAQLELLSSAQMIPAPWGMSFDGDSAV